MIHLKKITALLALMLMGMGSLQAQTFGALGGEVKEDYLYWKEFVYGINFNTNGGLIGGAMFKHARVINERMYHSFSLEIVNVKHPKEERHAARITGNQFIPGKQNYLFMVRPQYGREFVLFKKAEKQGVQVNFIGAVGPTFGVVAPYLIEYQYPNNVVRTEQYDPEKHSSFFGNILGTGSVFRSLSEAEIELGASLKTSFTFEFGTFKTNVTGFEAGFMMDVFPNEIVIIPESNNRSVYTSAFVSLYYGIRK